MKRLTAGISFLVFSGFVVKVLGLIHKIILVRILSLEGITFYTLATPTILLLFSLASFGLKESVSKIVSENRCKPTFSNRSIILKGLKTSLIISSILCLIMALGGSFIANLLNENKLYYLFLASIPLCIIVSVGHVFKGYFSGLNMLNIISISQIIEQIVRIIFSLLLSFYLLKFGIVYACIGIIIGSFIGEVSSLLYMIIKASKLTSFTLKYTPHEDDLKRLLETSIPLVLSHAVGSFSYFLEPIILTISLGKIGVSANIINSLFGSVNGYVLPLLTLFGFLSYAISAGITPSMTSMYCQKEFKKTNNLLNYAIFMTLLPCGFLILTCFFFPKELLTLLYKESYGYQMVRYLSFFFFFYYVGIILNSVLYACSAKLILWISILSSAVRLLAIYLLCSCADINSLGLVIAFILSLSTTFFLSLYGCIKYLKFKINVKYLLCFCFIFFITLFLMSILNNHMDYIKVIIISSLFYLSLVLVFLRGILKKC